MAAEAFGCGGVQPRRGFGRRGGSAVEADQLWRQVAAEAFSRIGFGRGGGSPAVETVQVYSPTRDVEEEEAQLNYSSQ